MVLEWLLEARKERKHPLSIFLFSVIVSLVAIVISYMVFKENIGIFTIVLISLATVPFINSMIKFEEIETEEVGQKQNFLERHGDVIVAFGAMFLGMMLTMAVAFVVLPYGTVENIFNDQITQVKIIRGGFIFGNQFLAIFANNTSVLMLSFLFSFILGTGAILILAWNASVLAAAVGLIARSLGGVTGIPTAVLTFIPHGSFEITAYFIGAVAGGLISYAIMRRKSEKFFFIVQDSIKLLMIAVFFLIIGGFIESLIILF